MRPENTDPLVDVLGADDRLPRGRTPVIRKTSLIASGTPSTSSVDAESSRSFSFQAHHRLPSFSDQLPDDPILYLPPLLSPLPLNLQSNVDPRQGSEDYSTAFETRLPNIDPASLALHQALHHFRPTDKHYAARVYSQAFNWDDLRLPRDIEREWYCVVFRSRRRPDISSDLSLYQADREAHEEAVQNGGLILYWYGVPDRTGLNMATCIWQSRRHAVNAMTNPKHREAMKQAKDAYEVYVLERWVLKKEKGRHEISLSQWDGGEVGR